MTEEPRVIPKWLWYPKTQQVVEVISMGHFPDTVTVRTPENKSVEVPLYDLEAHHGQQGA